VKHLFQTLCAQTLCFAFRIEVAKHHILLKFSVIGILLLLPEPFAILADRGAEKSLSRRSSSSPQRTRIFFAEQACIALRKDANELIVEIILQSGKLPVV